MQEYTRVLLDESDIDRILTRMTHEILEIHKGSAKLALVGIHTRGVFMAKRIQQRIMAVEHADIPVGVLDITLYRDDWTRIGSHPVLQATDIGFSIDGRQVILVDDVLFTGRTIRAAMDALIDFGRPDRIELAVMVDRGHRELPIQANYIGKIVATRRSETVNVMFREKDNIDQVTLQSEE
ncbi:MAG: bifunctional pyr operon transcriptional regulator/uracil phosphoribosyltransferase PyrR [Desulfatirhabdiaceae bacterium]